MRGIISIIGAALLICSCSGKELSGHTDSPQGGGVPVDVEFRVCCADSAGTRSSIPASETAVTDLNLLVYHDGRLEASSYIESPTAFSMSLVRGRAYSMYALANMGRVNAPLTEDRMRGYQYSITKVTDIRGGFPMCWTVQEKAVSGDFPCISISLERMVSRISFSIDSSELEDFTVTAVRLRQGALKMYPFLQNGSRAGSPSDVGDGDWASSSDLVRLNTGEKAVFYAMENCQGVLLPGNSSPESKIPSEIPSSADLCTYLEMTASYTGEYEGVTVSSDNVVYRFYIGNDNCSDFNVTRNSDVDISLTVTRDRIFDESWKVSYGEDLPEVTYGLAVSKPVLEVNATCTASLSALYVKMVGGVRTAESDVSPYAAWSSSDESVAAVSGGVVSGLKPGTATITATYNGYSAKATVTVTDHVTHDYRMTPESASVVNGGTTRLTIVRRTLTNGVQTGGEDYSSRFTWTSGDTSVATVDGNGVVTGAGCGSTAITARYDGTTLTGTVTVTPYYTYELVLNHSSLRISKGGQSSLVATYNTYADGVLESSCDVTSSAVWSSSSTSVAGVSSGKVTANGVGTAAVSATYNGASATCSVSVFSTPTLSLGWSSANLEKGDVRTNAAIYNPNNGTASTNVTSSATWTTSDAGVATVGGGKITAQGTGTCIITATYNGVSASCTVNVTSNDHPLPSAHVTSMSVQPVNVKGTGYHKLQLSIRFSDGTVIEDAPYSWSVTYAQNSEIAEGTGGSGPIVYLGGSPAYTMTIAMTTSEHYYNSSGNRQQFSTGISFSHNTAWKP